MIVKGAPLWGDAWKSDRVKREGAQRSTGSDDLEHVRMPPRRDELSHLRLKNNRASAINNTDCRLVQRDIKRSVKLHGGSSTEPFTPSRIARRQPNDRISKNGMIFGRKGRGCGDGFCRRHERTTCRPARHLAVRQAVSLLGNPSHQLQNVSLVAIREVEEPPLAESWTVQGDPTEGVLIVAARKAGLEDEASTPASPALQKCPSRPIAN
jgi:hypothetical protein